MWMNGILPVNRRGHKLFSICYLQVERGIQRIAVLQAARSTLGSTMVTIWIVNATPFV